MKAILQQHKQYLLTGVSYVIPFIACGGILIALSLAYAFRFLPPGPNGGPDLTNAPVFIKDMALIGGQAFDLFPAVLAGFIAYAMAGKPGLVPGFIGGAIAGIKQTVGDQHPSAGFLGALLIGLVAGHVVNLLKRMSVPKLIKPVMPIIIIPIISSLVVGCLMLVLDMPIAGIMVTLNTDLQSMQSGSQIVLAMLLGAMIAFDMGGPVNKAAFFFGVAMIQQHNYAIMGPQTLDGGTARVRSGGAGHGAGGHYGGGHSLCRRRSGPGHSQHYDWLHGFIDPGHARRGGGSRAPWRPHCFAGGGPSPEVCRRHHRRLPDHRPPHQLVKNPHGKALARAGGKIIMKIVAVTACPTGIAHTYMAAEQLEKTAKKLGHQIKVETQGAMGLENELSQADIDGAVVAIMAVDIAVEQPERFAKIRQIQVPVQDAVKNPEAIFARI